MIVLISRRSTVLSFSLNYIRSDNVITKKKKKKLKQSLEELILKNPIKDKSLESYKKIGK